MRIQDLFANLLLENEQRSRQMIKRYGAQIEPRLLNELPAFQDEAADGQRRLVTCTLLACHPRQPRRDRMVD
jgi:hypothetical protein